MLLFAAAAARVARLRVGAALFSPLNEKRERRTNLSNLLWKCTTPLYHCKGGERKAALRTDSGPINKIRGNFLRSHHDAHFFP